MLVLSKRLECIIKTIKHETVVYDLWKEVVLARNQNGFSESMSTIYNLILPGLDVQID